MKKESLCKEWLFCEQGKEKRTITLPHDAMQEQGRNKEAPSGKNGAYFAGGIYEYEKILWAPKEWETQEILLEFEGVYPNARVFLNGKELGGCRYGYTLFRVPLDGLRYDAQNQLLVKVDNSQQPNSRWYTGAGIYRPVWLLTAPKAHIEPDGVRITTLSYDPARISIEVKHTAKEDQPVEISIEIFDGEEKIAEGTGSSVELQIPDAKLWSDDHPYLYQCRVSLRCGETTDTTQTTFGIRKLEWSPRGFFVNGKSVLLKGGCIHHDNGILGARSYDASEWRRIRRLKDWGFNAIRSAHNPACRAMLEACDALGVYVMDELWDMWNEAKNPYDYAREFPEHYEEDCRSIAAKDYNHPSVILYSIGNEVTEPRKPEGVRLAADLVEKMHRLDPTRPVTAGMNLTLLLLASMEKNPLESGEAPAVSGQMDSTAYNQMVSEMGMQMTLAAATEPADKISSPVLDLLDIAGYNYAVSRYEKEGELHPNRIIVGSETYAYELAKTWKQVEALPYVIGDFMWTAWDYLGETGIGSWTYGEEERGFQKAYPWLLADTGAFDILGNDNAEAGLAAVVWGKRKTPYIGVRPLGHPGEEPNRAIWRGSNAVPSWSWKQCAGECAHIEVYSNQKEVELFQNGKSIGRKETVDCRADFQTVYEPGELRAVAYDSNGCNVSESILRSADEHTQIRIVPEEGYAGQDCILYLKILLTGENGEIECHSDTTLHISVTGGELLAFGSANPKTEESFLTGTYTTYYGQCQAVVRAGEEQLTVRVSGEGMEPAEITVGRKVR
ncbi:MAG: glycoside hydrolase family 2 TIM barrel-domain containing protein [Eubacteriales bacterium]|nr:glycoside hydrolase family 2 TIM barrel-domain containing protein [Eubacteriales bacterium]